MTIIKHNRAPARSRAPILKVNIPSATWGETQRATPRADAARRRRRRIIIDLYERWPFCRLCLLSTCKRREGGVCRRQLPGPRTIQTRRPRSRAVPRAIALIADVRARARPRLRPLFLRRRHEERRRDKLRLEGVTCTSRK